MRHLHLALLLLGTWGVLAPPAVWADETGAPEAPWRDPVVLEAHLQAACEAVEAACGARFDRRPTLRLSTQPDIESILATRTAGQRGMLEAAPHETRAFLAYYEPIAMEVHVLPDQLEAVARGLGQRDLLDEDLLRIILVHEVTHALDFHRFPVRWVLACCDASDERLAIEAVLEGHAQLVTEEVARLWGIEAAFQRLTRLYTGASTPSVDGQVAFDQEAAFTYLQGQAFMRAIRNERGREGLAEVLRDPPGETRVIDRPLLWLDPVERTREPDLQAVLEVFRPLTAGLGHDVSKWRLLGPPRGEASSVLPSPPSDLEGYVDNHGLYAASPDGSSYLNVFLARWATPEEADRFVAALRRVDEGRDGQPGWQRAVRQEGAGPTHALPGFTSWRRSLSGGPNAELALHVARQGTTVIELSAYGVPARERDAQGRALELATRLLAAPPATAAAVHLRYEVKAFLGARDRGDIARAGLVLRDLLPTEQDLRRVVRPEAADAFAVRYQGTRIALRATVVSNMTVLSTLAGLDAETEVRAWAATTEELRAGTGHAARFPPQMRAFAEEIAAPGIVWSVLVLKPRGASESVAYASFARLADRFLWITDPWTVVQ